MFWSRPAVTLYRPVSLSNCPPAAPARHNLPASSLTLEIWLPLGKEEFVDAMQVDNNLAGETN